MRTSALVPVLLFAFLTACASSATTPATPVAPPAAVPCPVSSEPATPPAKNDAPAAPKSIADVATAVVARMNAKDADGLFAMFDKGMRDAFPRDRVAPIVEQFHADMGNINSVKRAQGESDPASGNFGLSAEHGLSTLQVSIDDQGLITGISVHHGGGDAGPPPIARSTIALTLPFKGEWAVIWGGATRDMNRHVDAPSQRRAADLVRLGTDGSTHRGKGDANADYYAYGEDVIAVADGTVVTAIDGIPENTPGEVNPEMLTGNAIIVQHTPSLYSLYAHLKTGSVRVKVGTKVKRGQTLGLCGNSGNSTEPHLHFQLQDAARFDKSWGVEPVFAGVSITRDGQTTAASDYTFLKGDRVRAAK